MRLSRHEYRQLVRSYSSPVVGIEGVEVTPPDGRDFVQCESVIPIKIGNRNGYPCHAVLHGDRLVAIGHLGRHHSCPVVARRHSALRSLAIPKTCRMTVVSHFGA